jgi:hypothetical protein
MPQEHTREELYQACRFLAGQCDGAVQRDNIGFNAPDAGLGHYLAEIDGSAWSKAQTCWAYYELVKYKDRQLVGVVDWEQLEKPEFVFSYGTIARNDRWAQICQERERVRQERKEREKQPTTLVREGNKVRVSFPYDAGLVAAVKDCPGRRFNGSSKTWVVPISLDVLEPLVTFAEQAEVAIPEEVLAELLALAEKAEQTKEASRAMDADFDVPGLGGKLRPFQQAGVAYAVEQSGRGGVLISDEMGCIDGEAIISVNRAGGTRKLSLAKLFARFNAKWDKTIPTFCKSLTGEGELRLNEIQAVLDKGVKPVYRLSLLSGKTLRLTADHEIATPDGWKTAEHCQPGDAVLTNGQAVCVSCGSTDGIATYKHAKFPGYCRTCVYRTKRHNHTQKTGKFIDQDGYVRVSGQHAHPRQHGGQVYEHILVAEQFLGRALESGEVVHHKDENRANNAPDNLAVISHAEHHRAHRRYLHMNGGRAGKGGEILFVPRVDQVASCEPDGNAHVYDVVMADPHRNFVANGIVVHNCGKTIEALATLQAKQAFPAIIICPASLKLNWAKEIRQWLPGRSYAVWNGKQQAGSDIVIINYDIVKKHGEKLAALGAKAVVLDESHYCKNGKALRTKAVAALAKNIPLKLALTGTPVLNRPSELISQLDILGRLDDMGGFWPFAKRYCDAFKGEWGWDFSGADNLEELNEKLRASCMVRRLKKDVLSELPAKQRTEIPLEITNRREYDKAERELIAWLRQDAVEDKAFLASLKGLSEEEKKRDRHAKADSAEMAARRAEQLVKIEALKQLAWKGKMAGAISWVTDTLESEKLVLFCWHKEAVAALQEEFKCPVITGEVSIEERQRAVEKFQSDETCRLIVLNIRAGGVGLTLTAASNVAFLEMGWTPADHDQAEDRCHRMGQTDHVTAWYLIGERTIDERIMALVNEKRAIVEQATDGTGEGGSVSVLKELVRDLMA